MLPRHPDHLLRPREANVTTDNPELWELQRNLVNVLLSKSDTQSDTLDPGIYLLAPAGRYQMGIMDPYVQLG